MSRDEQEWPAVSIKSGQLVRNERHRRWGQVIWDAKKYQYASGEPGRILVWDTERRGTMDWPLADISVVVEKGEIAWEAPDLAGRLEQEWQAVAGVSIDDALDAVSSGRPYL